MSKNATKASNENLAVLSETEKAKFSIDLLERNYSVFEDRVKQYFTYLYNTIQFTLVYYGGILVLLNAFTGPKQDNKVTFSLIAFYALPIVTYILGLFYAYNSLALYRIGEEQIAIEKRIASLATEKLGINFVISQWNEKAKDNKHTTGFILPYGTMLMFYILVPLCIVLAFDFLIGWTRDTFFWVVQFAVPLGIWLVFFAFMLVLIFKLVKTKGRIKKAKRK